MDDFHKRKETSYFRQEYDDEGKRRGRGVFEDIKTYRYSNILSHEQNNLNKSVTGAGEEKKTFSQSHLEFIVRYLMGLKVQ